MAKKLSAEERKALIEGAFAKDARAAHASQSKAAEAAIAAIIDAGCVPEYEPRDGFYCLRVDREGDGPRRFVGPTAAAAATSAVSALGK